MADNITEALGTDSDASVVGMAITESGLEITVAGAASAALTKAISDQAEAMPVSIRVVDHSAAQLAAVQEAISADISYWAAQGIRVSAWGPDLATNKLEVSLANYSARAAQAIIARYGDEWVSVSTVSVTVIPL